MKIRIFCLLSLLVWAKTSVVAQGRFSVGLTAAPVLSHVSTSQTLALPDPSGSGQVIYQTFDSRLTTWGYVAGGVVQYAFTPKWSVASGLWYNQFRTNSTYPFAPGNIPARVISSVLRVPLLVNYRLTTRRMSPYVSAGAIGSFRRPTLYKPESGSGLSDTKVLFGRHALTVQAVVGAGVAYQVNSHWSLTVQPQLIWYFKPNDSYQRYVSYQLNGQTQLLYTF